MSGEDWPSPDWKHGCKERVGSQQGKHCRCCRETLRRELLSGQLSEHMSNIAIQKNPFSSPTNVEGTLLPDIVAMYRIEDVPKLASDVIAPVHSSGGTREGVK